MHQPIVACYDTYRLAAVAKTLGKRQKREGEGAE